MTIRRVFWGGLDAVAASGRDPQESRELVALAILNRRGFTAHRHAMSDVMRSIVWANAIREADTWARTTWSAEAEHREVRT